MARSSSGTSTQDAHPLGGPGCTRRRQLHPCKSGAQGAGAGDPEALVDRVPCCRYSHDDGRANQSHDDPSARAVRKSALPASRRIGSSRSRSPSDQTARGSRPAWASATPRRSAGPRAPSRRAMLGAGTKQTALHDPNNPTFQVRGFGNSQQFGVIRSRASAFDNLD